MATKEFGASVPEEEYQRFQVRFGGFYGATKWFITTALKEFNDRVEREPTLQLQVAQAIESMVQEARKKDEEITWIPGVGFRRGTDPITEADWKVMEKYWEANNPNRR
jgi:hypothetical protein